MPQKKSSRRGSLSLVPPPQKGKRPLTDMGRRMERRREQLNLNQADAAARCTPEGEPTTAQSRWSAWTRADPSTMQVETVYRIARALNVHPGWLLFGTHAPEDDPRSPTEEMLSAIDPKMRDDDRMTLRTARFHGRAVDKRVVHQWYLALQNAPRL